MVIEQSVLGLAPSHPPLKDFYGPSACDHIPQKTGNRSIKVTPLPSWQRKKNTEIKGQKERTRERPGESQTKIRREMMRPGHAPSQTRCHWAVRKPGLPSPGHVGGVRTQNHGR